MRLAAVAHRAATRRYLECRLLAQGFARLRCAAPNPAGGEVAIRFTLARPSAVRLEVFDVAGRRVAVVLDGWRPSGRFAEKWDGGGSNGSVGAGVYVARFSADGRIFNSRLIRMGE